MRPRVSLVQRHRLRPRLEMTALVDCVFLLLIFFLLTSTTSRHRRIRLDLPEVAHGENLEPSPQKLDIGIASNGSVSVGERTCTRMELEQALRAADQKASIRIMPDAGAPASAILAVLDTVKAAERSSVDIVAQQGEGADF